MGVAIMRSSTYHPSLLDPCFSFFHHKGRIVAGRMASVLAVLLFGAIYLYGAWNFPLILWILIGWLPAALLAWIAAQLAYLIANKNAYNLGYAQIWLQAKKRMK